MFSPNRCVALNLTFRGLLPKELRGKNATLVNRFQFLVRRRKSICDCPRQEGFGTKRLNKDGHLMTEDSTQLQRLAARLRAPERKDVPLFLCEFALNSTCLTQTRRRCILR